MSFLERIYPHLPVRLQNLAVSGYGYLWRKRRFGGIFDEQLRLFREREGFTRSQWSEYQTKELRRLLLHAFDTVPFYNRSLKERGLSRTDLAIFDLSDLSKLPILQKEHLRQFGTSDLLSIKRNKAGKFFTSSGSTGTPVKILFSEPMHQKWRAAFEARIYNWAELTHNSSRGMIGGRMVVPGGDRATAPFYRYNHFEKQIYFSIYHIRKENAWSYLEAINKYRPEFMTGYAASNYLLATYFESLGLRVEPLKAVITSSEKLTQAMRATLSRVYNCRVFDSWSGIEACGLISEHPNGCMYSSPDVGIIEILDDNLRPVKAGETGSLYCTGFLNYDQPLIRYKIGDLATPLDDAPLNGPQMPVFSEIVGRIDDTVTLKDGRQLSSFNRFFADIKELLEVQVEQIDYDYFKLNIVAGKQYDSQVEKALIDSVHKRLGKVTVVVNPVSHIPRGQNGKFKAVISHLGVK